MPKYNVGGITATRFLFNHVIARFGITQVIVTDHESNFHQYMMEDLTTQLVLRHDRLNPYYPQANNQVEVINKFLITMLQQTIGKHKKDWDLMLFSTLWDYQTSTKTSTSLTPF